MGREGPRVPQRVDPTLPGEGSEPHEAVPQLTARRYEREKIKLAFSFTVLLLWRLEINETPYSNPFLKL